MAAEDNLDLVGTQFCCYLKVSKASVGGGCVVASVSRLEPPTLKLLPQ